MMTQDRANLETALNLLDGVQGCENSRKKVKNLCRHFFNVCLGEVKKVSALTHAEVTAGKLEGKIAAIKMHRDRTLMGLRESKETVEKYFSDNNLSFKSWD